MPALLLAVVAGLALGASFVDFRLWPVPWLAMAVLVGLAERATPRRACALGYCAGLAGIALAFHWLVYAIRVFGGFPGPLALLIAGVPMAWMALQVAIFTALVAWLPRLPGALTVPVAFTGVEFLFPSLFPWRLAHTQYAIPALLQSGELAGPFLLSFTMTWIAAALAGLAPDREHRAPPPRRALAALLPPALLLATLVAWGNQRMAAVEDARTRAPALRVGVVQGNIDVEQKGQRALFTRNLDVYRRLSHAAAARVDLLVWPETVVQRHIVSPVPSDLPAAENPFPGAPRPLLFGGLGATGVAGRRRVFNSAFLVHPGGRLLGRYDKRILVPFGEYMPLAARFPSLQALSPATGRFRAGTGARVLAGPGPARLGPLICYEDVVPEPARAAVRDGATLLINLTNDAWYGDGPEPLQHQALAIWRAVETRRDFVRSTNTGLTSIITATGRVAAVLPTFRAATLVGEVRLLVQGTPYATYGDVVGWAIAMALGALVVHRLTLRPA